MPIQSLFCLSQPALGISHFNQKSSAEPASVFVRHQQGPPLGPWSAFQLLKSVSCRVFPQGELTYQSARPSRVHRAWGAEGGSAARVLPTTPTLTKKRITYDPAVPLLVYTQKN